LLGLLALVLFGDYRKGRPKGEKVWDTARLISLTCHAYFLKRQGLSAAAACRHLGKGGCRGSSFRRFDPVHLEKLLPEARRVALGYYYEILHPLYADRQPHLDVVLFRLLTTTEEWQRHEPAKEHRKQKGQPF
jgi:hypothetical protein